VQDVMVNGKWRRGEKLVSAGFIKITPHHFRTDDDFSRKIALK